MLDFGSRMADPEPERDDNDLFAAASEEESAVSSFEPEAKEEASSPIPEPEEEFRAEPAVESKPRRQLFSFLRKGKTDPLAEIDCAETAEVLKAAREHAGYTLQDVERETQIRVRYLEALEQSDISRLPQQVYVLAYLRKLCGLYRISPEDEEALVRPWRNLQRELPENLPATMIRDEEKEPQSIWTRAEFYLLALGAIIVIGIVTFLVIFAVSYFNSGRVEPHFDNDSLLELQAKPQLIVPDPSPARRP